MGATITHTIHLNKNTVCPLIPYSTWIRIWGTFKWLPIERGNSRKRVGGAVPNTQDVSLKPWRAVRPGEEQQYSKLQESKSVKNIGRSLVSLFPLLAVACLLSITVNITERVQEWEEVKHKPDAQCTCLAAACSDI